MKLPIFGGKEKQATVAETELPNTPSEENSVNDAVEETPLGPEPTDEELATLRKVRDHFPFSAFLVAIVELAERFTYYGLTGPFQNYIQRPIKATTKNGPGYHGDGPGGIGQNKYDITKNQSMATGLTTFFTFWCYVTPIPMAILADMKLGKYWTICLSSGIYVIGLLVLFVTSLPQYRNENNTGLGGLIASMIIIGIGTGGIKSNVSTLIAEQYTVTRPYVRTEKSGERVIVDPSTTVQYIYLIFYWAINIGSLSAIATTELERNVDFWPAFLLPFAFFGVAIVVLIIGRKKYIVRKPEGSPIPWSTQIVWMAFKNGLQSKEKRFVAPREDEIDRTIVIPKSKFVETLNKYVYSGFTWWRPFAERFTVDIAKPTVRSHLGLSPVPWTDTFVEEVSRAVNAAKVFVFFPIYWICYSQITNNLTSQAGQTQTHELPNDILQNLDPITIIIFVPIFDRLIYPGLRRLGFQLLPITRITFGFFVTAISMGYTAGFQKLIYSRGPCFDHPLDKLCKPLYHNNDPDFPETGKNNDVHVAIQTPSWFFMGISEILASATGNEFAFKYAPASMKSFVMSLFLLTNAFGSAINEALNPTLVNPKIMYMYTGISVAAFIAGIVFWFVYQDLNDRELYYEKLSILVHKEEEHTDRDLDSEEYFGINHGKNPGDHLQPIASAASGKILDRQPQKDVAEEEKIDEGLANAAVFSPAP